MPAQSNATLTRINESDVSADWESSDADDGPVKWEGRARAYYTEKTSREWEAGKSTVVLRRALILDHDDARAIDNNDVLTFVYDGAEQRARAKLIERRDLKGISSDLRTTRIELDDA